MGASSPSPSPFNNFNPLQWHQIDPISNTKILHHQSNPHLSIQQHSIIISDHQQLQKTIQLYLLRNHDPQLVATHYIHLQMYEEVCSQLYSGSIFTERIPLRLSNIIFLPFPDILHLYNQCFNGFARLAKQLGYFKVNEDCIGINQKNIVKVWLNSNFSQINPHSTISTEQQMVKNIVELIESNTNPITMPSQQPSFSQFLYKDNHKINFQQSKKKLQQYVNHFNHGILPNHLTQIDATHIINNSTNKSPPINLNSSNVLHLEKQQTKGLTHCNSAHSLSTVDIATQTKVTNQINKQSTTQIGDYLSNSRSVKTNRLNQLKTFYQPKSKTKFSINYLTQQPPQIPIKINNQQHKIVISPSKLNQTSSSYQSARSQSQSKLHYPNSKLDSQQALIRSGTMKTLKTNPNVSLMTIYEQPTKPIRNHHQNIHSIWQAKFKSPLPIRQSTQPQSSLVNPSNQHKPNQANHQFPTSPIENTKSPSNYQFQLKTCQPPTLTPTQFPQPSTLYIPPLHFRSSSIKTPASSSTFRFSLSSNTIPREKQHLSLDSRTNYSNQKNLPDKNPIIQFNYQINQLHPPLQSSSKHHGNLSIPPSELLQNPQLIPSNTFPINIQVPIQNNIIAKQTQLIKAQNNQNNHQIVPQQQINLPIKINTQLNNNIISQPHNQINYPPPQQFHLFNYQLEKYTNQQFNLSSNPSHPVDHQFKILSKINHDPEFTVNQSISSIAYRQDQDCSISYLDWPHKDSSPKTIKTMTSHKIIEITNQNHCQPSHHVITKEQNNRNLANNLLDNNSHSNQPIDNYANPSTQCLFRQTTNICNYIQNFSQPHKKLNQSNPKESSYNCSYNAITKHTNGTVASLAPTYSTPQKQSNKKFFPIINKAVPLSPRAEQTIINLRPQYQQQSNGYYNLDYQKFRYYLVESSPYNIEWDPQILADLKANMQKN